MNKTIFSSTKSTRISSNLNSYMKENFGYEVSGDLEELRNAKIALEAQKREMRVDHQDRAYVENMLMLETIKALLKAHVAEGELPPGLKAYQDKKNGKKSDAKKDEKEDVKESKERPYICVHAKKGKHECHAETSYDAAQKAAKHWKLKSTSGIDAHLAVEEKVAEGKYKSDAQRKAVHAAKSEKTNETDAPKVDTMTKYSNTYEAPKEYKMKKEKLEEGLLAQLNALLEGDAQNAEITMAARGIVDELQDMIEKLGKIQNDQLGPLTDEMAYSHGPDQAQAFKEASDDAISGLLGTARSAKEAVNNAVLVLSGEAPESDDSMSMNDDELGGDLTADFEDDITADMNPVSGDESAAGPEDEPLGRAKRSS